MFVTVGTTKFDALVEAMDNDSIASQLASRGYRCLIMQIGDGAYVPHILVPKGASKSIHSSGLQVEVFKYAPNLDAHMRDADLVISHAGSGSLFEALRLGKALVAVPNAILMANHQAELAGKLERMEHCVSATPETLLETLQSLDVSKLKPYQKGDASAIVAAIDKHMGF